MVLKANIVLDPITSIEVFLDNIREVSSQHNREDVTFPLSQKKEIDTVARNRNPAIFDFTGTIQTDIIEKKRKLIYLNSYPDNIITIDGGNRNAIYGMVKTLGISDNNPNSAAVDFTSKAKGGVSGQYIPIGDTTSTGSSSTDSDAVGDAVELLDAITEVVHYSITQNVYELPEGDYKLLVRLKDANQVADDVQLTVYNTTDAASIATDTYTATAAFSYFLLDFTIDSADVGDSIKLSIDKATANANTITVDFIAFVKV